MAIAGGAADAGRPGPPEQVTRTENTPAKTVWRIDLRTPGMPRCTSQNPTDDSTPNTAPNAGCNLPTATTSNAGQSYDQNAGHENWWAATFTGPVMLTAGYPNYTGASLLVGWDSDLDFAMWPNSGSSLTAGNVSSKSGAFSMEFDGDEVTAQPRPEPERVPPRRVPPRP